VLLRGLWRFLVGVLLAVLAELLDLWVHKLQYGKDYSVARFRMGLILFLAILAVFLRSSRARWVLVAATVIWGAGFAYQAAAYRSADAALISAGHLGAAGLKSLRAVSEWLVRRTSA